ncbi:winged helix DNA-binding domain-containing protein [Dactylosporangium sp. NPDC005572]|uniref:winged helix DNA-binding domain-containing protein n=1 Tax=Dactylosporangium sp. NPDC005572 TaxID=3156889 RepID=UPI0033B5609E
MEQTLTWRALNRALLARQMLLERAALPVPEALERMGGLQAQYAPSMYIGLWSRVADLDRDEVTRLLERREVVQATLLRGTIHLVSRADFWPFASGVHKTRLEWYVRATRSQYDPAAMEAAVAELRELLREGPVRRTELDKRFGAPIRNGLGMYLDLVRVPPSGTWARRRADLFGAAEDWVGAPDATEREGQELLVRRYLGAFGPAHRTEIADWAGLPVATVAEILKGLDLQVYRDEAGRELVDLPGAPLPDPETPAPVRFLPTWDAALLAHARRTRILPEEHRSKVFHVRMPQSIGTFLVDGQVAGTWRYTAGQGLTWEPFATLPARVRRQVTAEADRLADFHG